MRVGIVRSTAAISGGGIFQYELAFLEALSEFAPSFAGEFLYLTARQSDLAALAHFGGLNYRRRLTIRMLDQPRPQQLPPEAYLKLQPTALPPSPDPDPSINRDDQRNAPHQTQLNGRPRNRTERIQRWSRCQRGFLGFSGFLGQRNTKVRQSASSGI
jgi:hypothetical protein